MVQSRQSGDGGVGSCDRVGVEEGAPIGPIVVGITGGGREPAASLDIGAVRDVVTVRSGLAKTRDRHHDDLGIGLAQNGILEVEVAHNARAVILQNDVGLRDQPEKQFPPRFVVQVERDPQFISIQFVEICRAIVVMLERVAAWIPTYARRRTIRRLDLDDLCSKISQVPCRERLAQLAVSSKTRTLESDAQPVI